MNLTRLFAASLLAGMLLAAVQPTQAIRQFIVFFSDNKSGELDPVQWRIGPEGEAVIKEVAIAYGLYGGRILLVAGDQRLGTLEDSIERSRRRANAVRELLVKHGVERADIFTMPCGFVRYLAETPAETREPMNRFVALDVLPEDTALTDGARSDCERKAAQ